MEPASIENLGTGIEVRSLYFRYSDVEPWLLENVSFRIERTSVWQLQALRALENRRC